MAFIVDPTLYYDRIQPIQHCTNKCHSIANCNLLWRFVGKLPAIVVIVSCQVYRGYENDANQRSQHSNELFNTEPFNAKYGAEKESPNTACGGKNREAGHTCILQASFNEVIRSEPEQAEL